VFDIYLFIDNSRLCKSDAGHKLEAKELQAKLDDITNIKFPVTKVETFITEPVIIKNKISFSDYVSMDDDTMQRIIFEDLAKNLVDEFMSNPSFVRIDREENPMFCNKTYISTIRLVPYRED
jgi:hypothetical protein